MVKKPKHISKKVFADGENLVLETRHSRIKYMTGATISILFAIFFILIGFWTRLDLFELPFIQQYLEGEYGNIISLVCYAIGGVLILNFIAKWLKWSSTIYALTDSRIMIKKGILGRSIEDMSLRMVTNIDVRQSAWQRFLGYGTIVFSSEGGTVDDVVWKYVPDPFKVRRLVQEAMNARTLR